MDEIDFHHQPGSASLHFVHTSEVYPWVSWIACFVSSQQMGIYDQLQIYDLMN